MTFRRKASISAATETILELSRYQATLSAIYNFASDWTKYIQNTMYLCRHTVVSHTNNDYLRSL